MPYGGSKSAIEDEEDISVDCVISVVSSATVDESAEQATHTHKNKEIKRKPILYIKSSIN
jgi:hypothetical protein